MIFFGAYLQFLRINYFPKFVKHLFICVDFVHWCDGHLVYLGSLRSVIGKRSEGYMYYLFTVLDIFNWKKWPRDQVISIIKFNYFKLLIFYTTTVQVVWLLRGTGASLNLLVIARHNSIYSLVIRSRLTGMLIQS